MDKTKQSQYNNRNNFVICGFSGVGKSTAEQKNRRILDFESSAFSKLFKNGFCVGENPNFPSNYIDKLAELIDSDYATYYLLSCHYNVREELRERCIDYIIVMPTIEQKNEYLKRWLKRGSSTDFIRAMDEKWDDMITSCIEDPAPKVFLSENEYISNLICL